MQSSAKNIKIFITDVDGVMTDGKVLWSADGEQTRSYDMHDGIFSELKKRSILTAWCSGESDGSIEHRAKKLKIDHVMMGSTDKVKDISGLLEENGFAWDQVCYVGDDLADIPALKLAGLACAPSNAREQVKAVCDYVSKAAGGDGAIREIYEKFFEELPETE